MIPLYFHSKFWATSPPGPTHLPPQDFLLKIIGDDLPFKVENIGVLAGVALTNMIPMSTPGQFGIFPNIARLVGSFYVFVFNVFVFVSTPGQVGLIF